MGGKKWLSGLASAAVAGNESNFEFVQVSARTVFVFPFFVPFFFYLPSSGGTVCALCVSYHRRPYLFIHQGEGDGASPAEFLDDGPVQEDDGREVASSDEPKRVMCLMSDTGGGHRASAQALRDGFEALYGA